jgi:2-oxoglutarate dehydrogenase E2 component (dihydrolipoamide succinyltransferase)
VPVVNARIDGAAIVYNRHVQLGIAVSTERGLVVPVIRHADAMSLAELERAVAELTTRARDARLLPGDLGGGTFSITNHGVFARCSPRSS